MPRVVSTCNGMNLTPICWRERFIFCCIVFNHQRFQIKCCAFRQAIYLQPPGLYVTANFNMVLVGYLQSASSGWPAHAVTYLFHCRLSKQVGLTTTTQADARRDRTCVLLKNPTPGNASSKPWKLKCLHCVHYGRGSGSSSSPSQFVLPSLPSILGGSS